MSLLWTNGAFQTGLLGPVEIEREEVSTRNMTEAVSSDGNALLTRHVLVGMSTGWIVDWWATSHMCTSRKLYWPSRFQSRYTLLSMLEVTYTTTSVVPARKSSVS